MYFLYLLKVALRLAVHHPTCSSFQILTRILNLREFRSSFYRMGPLDPSRRLSVVMA